MARSFFVARGHASISEASCFSTSERRNFILWLAGATVFLQGQKLVSRACGLSCMHPSKLNHGRNEHFALLHQTCILKRINPFGGGAAWFVITLSVASI